MNIDITVNNKTATVTTPNARIVCGNSDYTITFSFSPEWDKYEQKTARFIYADRYEDKNFTGNVCECPIISNAREVKIGVYAGEISTTTPARVDCDKSILCDDIAGTESDGVIITKGDDGLSAYEVAVNNGFEGTETEWLESLNGSGDYYERKFEDIIPVEYEEPVIGTITESDSSDNFALKIAELPENAAPFEMVSNFVGWVKGEEETRIDDKELFSIAERAEMKIVSFGLVDGEAKGAMWCRQGLPVFIVTSADNLEYVLNTVEYGEAYEYHFAFPKKGIYAMITDREPDENGVIKYKSFDKILFSEVTKIDKKSIPVEYVTVDEIPKNPDLLNEFSYENEQLLFKGEPLESSGVVSEGNPTCEKVASAFDFNFNLFDKSTATAGSYIDNTEIKTNGGYYLSDYIEIKPSTYYIVPSTLNNLGSEFDENKNLLRKITKSNLTQPYTDKSLLDTSSNAKYIRVNIFVGSGTAGITSDINTFMVLQGTEYPEKFKPYNGLKPVIKPDCIIEDEEATNTEEVEKVINAFDFNFNLFDKKAATIGSYAVRENINTNSSYYVSDYIEVKPSTYYIVPITASQVGSYFDENKTYLGQFKRSNVSQPYTDKTVIFTSATTKYIRVNGFSGVGTASVTCPITEYMVIEGQTYPESYIPYNGLKPIIKPECVTDDEEFVEKVNRSNILYGKTLMTIGDSITRGYSVGVSEETGYEMTYGGLTAYRNDMTFINTGWSGGTIANDSVKPFISNGDINVALGDIIPDYLTVWYGWNDYAREAITLGDIDSTDETTYYGAWNIALNLLINRYPTTKIGVVVPYGMNAEWRQAVRDVAKKWGVPYLDLYENQSCIFDNESGVEPSIAALRKATFLADGCHPNSAGYEWLSTMYEAFLRRI